MRRRGDVDICAHLTSPTQKAFSDEDEDDDPCLLCAQREGERRDISHDRHHDHDDDGRGISFSLSI